MRLANKDRVAAGTAWAVDHKTGCWNWQLGKKAFGYGAIYDGGTMHAAHRYVYEKRVGEIPKGLQLLHSCDNPACVNPAHLRVGTHADNMNDKKLRGRVVVPTGERNHLSKFTSTDVERALDLRKHGHTLKEIGAHLGMHYSNVALIATGKIWKSVPRYAREN